MLADLCLVLLLDSSGSVDAAEWELQAKATADALASPAIVERILAGPHGAIAVAALEWSSAGVVAVPWARIASPGDAQSFALDLATYMRRQSGSTAMGDALFAAGAQLEALPAQVATGCLRQVVDISGDGTSNAGAWPKDAIAALAARDVIVNALVIQDEIGVVEYYERIVSGFVMPASWDSYRQAIKAKLSLEISAYPVEPRHAAGAAPLPQILAPGRHAWHGGLPGADAGPPSMVGLAMIGDGMTAQADRVPADPVPSPGSLALLAFGLFGLALARFGQCARNPYTLTPRRR